MKKLLEKKADIILRIVIVMILLAYIASVIRTEVLSPECEKGLATMIGVFFLPILSVFTIGFLGVCIKYLVDTLRSGKWVGIFGFVIFLVPSIFLSYLSITTFLEVTGIHSFGFFF